MRHVRRGHYRLRSPEISLIPHRPNYIGTSTQPPHTGPWDYLTDVPLVLYGPGFIRPTGESSRPASMVDLAPTAARLIGFEEWPRRAGRVLQEALVDTSRRPRLVVTVVWDGAGWNALEEHPRSWPFLEEMMRRAATYTNMTIGSSPSVTPPVHATLGTGVYPERHGVVAVRQRNADNEYIDPWLDEDPANLEVATLADLYDRARGNRPVTGMTATVNWHLGMLGHGAALPGADSDPALLINDDGVPFGNEAYYSLPDVTAPERLEAFARELDAADGEADGMWKGHPLDDSAVRYSSPAYTRYQELMLERMIVGEGFGRDRIPDLVYVNFKQPDDAGHKWGIGSSEVGRVLGAQDRQLRRLVDFLDEGVGRRRWVLMLTADHGQMPYPQDTGAWPIGGKETKNDANAVFDKLDNGIDLVDRVVANGAYIRRDELAANDVGLESVARWLAGYTVGENIKEGETIHDWFPGDRNDRLFDAVTIGKRKVIRACS